MSIGQNEMWTALEEGEGATKQTKKSRCRYHGYICSWRGAPGSKKKKKKKKKKDKKEEGTKKRKG